MTITKEDAHKHLQRIAGSKDISIVGPATKELWDTLCEYLQQGIVQREDFSEGQWEQILIHSRVQNRQIHKCVPINDDIPEENPPEDDDIPEENPPEEETPSEEDDTIEDEDQDDPEQPDTSPEDNNEEEEEVTQPTDNDDRLKSRVAEESEDDERYSESFDRLLLQNLKTIVDAFGTGFLAESLQDLRDYTEERRNRERQETRRLEQQDEERQMRLRQEQELFNQRMRHAEETFQDRRLGGQQAIRHADNAMGQQLRDQTRDNEPSA